MAIYDTEEEQIEQLKKWWEVNQSSVLSGLVGAVIIIVAFNFWQHYQLENRSAASQMYQEMLNNAAADKTDSVDKIAEKLIAEHGSTAYADYATLQLAKAKVQKGDLDAAKALLQNEIKNTGSDLIRHVCRLRLIQILLAGKQYEEGLKLIAEVDPAKSEGFAASYDELQGDIYVAMDRLDDARSAYQSAIRSGQASPFVQFKLDDIAAPAFLPNAGK